MDYLNDIEKAAVEAFYNNEGMRESVKKVLLRGIYHHFEPGKNVDELENLAFVHVSQNPSVENEVLGQKLRGLWEGVNALAAGFAKLSTIKKDEPKSSKPNRAR